MMLVEETQVLDANLPVAELRAHLRLGTGFAEDQVQDGLLAAFLRAAMAAIEARTGKILLEREFTWDLNAWRDANGQALPVAPVSALVSLALVDRFGVAVTVAAGAYRLEPDALRPRLMPMGGALPTIPSGGQARLRFLAGYGPEWADLPRDLGQAWLMLAAHYHEYRHDTGLGAGCMPFGVTSLIDRFRTLRILGGGVA